MRRLSLLTALVPLWLACGPAKPPESETLEVVIERLASAVESKQPRVILDHVGHDFVASDGLDFLGVQALVLDFLTRDAHYEAKIESLQIEAAPEATPGGEPARRVRAVVRFSAAQSADRDPATRYRLDLVFRQQQGLWKARSGRYERLSRDLEQG